VSLGDWGGPLGSELPGPVVSWLGSGCSACSTGFVFLVVFLVRLTLRFGLVTRVRELETVEEAPPSSVAL
jgi:hypothetical protein